MLDESGTIGPDDGKGERARVVTGDIAMARRQKYQKGSLFKRNNGRKVWVARWYETAIGPGGKICRVRRSEVLGLVADIPTKREAQRLLEDRLRSVNRGVNRPQATLTFAEFVREWEQAVEAKPNTMRFYQTALRTHLLPYFGELRLCDIRKQEVQSFLVAKKRQGGISGSHVHGIRNVLSKVLQAAVDWEYLEQNPARGIKIGERVPVRDKLYLTPEQLQALLRELPEPCRTLARFLALTGMRIGEALALRWRDINFLNRVVVIERTFSNGSFGTPKTQGSNRTIPLSEQALETLLRHRTGQRTAPDHLIFVSRVGTPMNPGNLRNRVLRPACMRAGVPGITWHSLRHTHTTGHSESGTPIRTTQEILGHSDAKTTMAYTHSVPDTARAAMQKVAELLDPIGPKTPNEANVGASLLN